MVAYSVTAVICPSAMAPLARQHASQPEDARHAQAQNQPYRRIDDGKHAAQADHGIGIVAKGLVRALSSRSSLPKARMTRVPVTCSRTTRLMRSSFFCMTSERAPRP